MNTCTCYSSKPETEETPLRQSSKPLLTANNTEGNTLSLGTTHPQIDHPVVQPGVLVDGSSAFLRAKQNKISSGDIFPSPTSSYTPTAESSPQQRPEVAPDRFSSHLPLELLLQDTMQAKAADTKTDKQQQTPRVGQRLQCGSYCCSKAAPVGLPRRTPGPGASGLHTNILLTQVEKVGRADGAGRGRSGPLRSGERSSSRCVTDASTRHRLPSWTSPV